MSRWLGLLLYLVSAKPPTCLDTSNSPVDWYVIYKFPQLSRGAPAAQAGLGYAYMDANNPSFVVAKEFLNDTTNNPLFFTLQQIYGNQASTLAYLMYNDENPITGVTSSTFGHSKGVAAWELTGGFWMTHTTPLWPPAGNSSYSFGAVAAPTYAQTFMCVNLDTTNLNTVFDQWSFTRPGVYSSQMDPGMNSTFPGAARVLAGIHVTQAPYTSVKSVTSMNGLPFTYFAKYTNWGMELYEDLVAPTLGVNMNTETWQNGVGSLNSTCNVTWNVQNIATIFLDTINTWPNSKDHAKWAISDSCLSNYTSLWICLGDINRQNGQLTRAGGTMCTQQFQLYSQFQKLIAGFKLSCTDGSICSTPEAPTPAVSGATTQSLLAGVLVTLSSFFRRML